MKMKRLLYVMGLLGALFIITSCDSNKENNSNSNSNQQTEQTDYMVNFNVGLGTYIMPTLVKSGNKVERPSTDPTRSDSFNETYIFAGWYKDELCTIPFDFETEIITENTTIYAKWDSAPRMYSVTFNSMGGSDVSAINTTYGSKITKPSNPSKSSTSAATFTFVGWYKDTTLNQAFDFDNDTITESITLYAKWDATPVEYTVTFNSNGGSNVLPQSIEYGNKLEKPQNPTKEGTETVGYAFAGWYKDSLLTEAFDFDNDTITTTTTLYAKWDTLNKYTVTFDSKGGSDVTSQVVLEGSLIDKPTDPTKEPSGDEYYDFAGWYEDELYNNPFDFENDTIGESITLYAKWTPAETITVTYRKGTYAENTIIGTQILRKSNDLLVPQLEVPALTNYRYIKCMIKTATREFDLANYANSQKASSDKDIFVEYEYIDSNSVYNNEFGQSELTGSSYCYTGSSKQQANFYQNGFVKDKFDDFNQYKNTSAYVEVANAEQLIQALENAQNTYTSTYGEIVEDAGKIVRNNVRKNETNWISAITKGLYLKNSDDTYTKIPSDTPFSDTTYTEDMTYYEDSNASKVTINQTLTKSQTVHVIEITNDIDLGYYNLSATAKSSSIVSNFCSKYETQILNGTAGFYVSSMLRENGISQITISRSTNLLIYSKNGSKITHGGFKVTSCDRVVFRNLEFDELWQWEDSAIASPTFTVGDMDLFGWAYFKISFSGYIWIDHCTFGKAYDGLIDVSNPYFYSIGTASQAPYGKPTEYTEEDSMGVHISNSLFRSGSDDPNGYLYKMMEEIEADYQLSLNDSDYACKCLYYKKLRDVYKASFEEILYGIAIPHKKAFLLGDSSESKKADTYYYNQHLKVSFADNIIIDIEDRLPNVRGGMVFMCNTLVDNSRYYKYRQILIDKGAKNIGATNSKYKLALVSQGIVGGYGASVYAQNCIFIGIDTLVKNNNSDKDNITSEQMAAGYRLVNCLWYNNPETDDYTRIIDTDLNPTQIASTVGQTSPMSVSYFSIHNIDIDSITMAMYDIDTLTQSLMENQNVGVNPNYDDFYLVTKQN